MSSQRSQSAKENIIWLHLNEDPKRIKFKLIEVMNKIIIFIEVKFATGRKGRKEMESCYSTDSKFQLGSMNPPGGLLHNSVSARNIVPRI